MSPTLVILAMMAVYIVVVICRLLAVSIREVNKWDRRSGG